MATTLRNRVELEGITVSDADALSQRLEDSAADIIGLLPESCLRRVADEATDSGNGVDAQTFRFLRAHKSGTKAIEVPAEHRALYEAGGDYEATAARPVFYVKGGFLYVLPSGGTVLKVDYPSVGYDDTVIAAWPRDFARLVALHAAMKEKEAALRSARTSGLPGMETEPSLSMPTLGSVTALDLSTITVPTPPAAPAIAYSDATANGISATTIGALPSAPVYVSPGTLSLTWTDFDAYEADEDPEMMQAVLQKELAEVQEYRAGMEDAANAFRANLADYQAEAQRVIEQARLDQERLAEAARQADTVALQNEAQTLQAAIQDYVLGLQQYDRDLAEYGASVEKEVLKHDADLRRVTELYATEGRFTLDEYTASSSVGVQIQAANIERFKTLVRTLRAEYADLGRRFREAYEAYVRNHRSTVTYDIHGYDV